MRNMFGRPAKAPEALMAGPSTMDLSRPALPERATTYVDASSEFTGSLKMSKSVHIDGSVDGEIECAAAVTIGPSGKVTARIRAESVLIDGEVHGDIEARTEITLRKSARVFGDLRTEGIVIERGAKVEGQITIGPTGGGKAAAPADSTTPTVSTAKPTPAKYP
ncbi:MAG TPA: polymer-forming cytoskeletal protein [Myxococcota bacterium]|nr:polymer-forming cytoskeletal protein [Myxococcota bacterium]